MEDKRIQQSQLNNQTNPPQSFVRRWLPTIVGVVIVVFGIGGFFLFQFLTKSSETTKAPTQEISTETWKLYTDSPFGNNAFAGSVPGYSLSLRIPPNFKENEGEGLFYYTGKSFSIIGEDENKASTVEFQVAATLLGGELEEEYKKLITKFRDMLPGATTEVDSASILKISDINLPYCVGPQILIEGAGNSPDMFEYQTLCPLGDDLGSVTVVFVLRARRNHTEEMDKYKPLYDTILSTFRYENLATKAEQNETENWKMYRNEEFGFEVKYPPGGEVTKTSYGPRIMLPLEGEGTNLSEKYLDVAVDGPSAHTGNLVSREQVFLGGKLFIKEDRSGVAAGNTYDTEFYIINHRGKEYNISFTLHSGNIGNYDPSIRPKVFDRDQEKKVFDQILPTFKFIELDETTNWKTYRNEEFGFEIKYPRSWAISSIPLDAFSLNLESITFNEVGKEYNIEESPIDAITVSIRAWDGASTPLDLANKRNEYGGTVAQFFIDGEKAAQLDDYIGNGTYVIGNGHLYVISTPTGLGEEVSNVYGSMISTFKFID